MAENPSELEARKRQPKPRRSGQVIARGEGKWLVRIFLLKAFEGTTYHPIFVFLLASGCRPGEALGLKWPDIDWQAGTVTIRRALCKLGLGTIRTYISIYREVNTARRGQLRGLIAHLDL